MMLMMLTTGTMLAEERLDRGVVAIKQADGKVFVSWRSLKGDAKDMAFDVYRNGVKLNKEPLTQGGTWFVDEEPMEGEAVYKIEESGKRRSAEGRLLPKGRKKVERGQTLFR